jgi:hypothetical protein
MGIDGRTSRQLWWAALLLLGVSSTWGIVFALGWVSPTGGALESHVHAGALGWLTLGGLAVATAMFATTAPERGWTALARGSFAAVISGGSLLVVSFAASWPGVERWAGWLAFAGVIGAVSAYMGVGPVREWSVPQLGMAGAGVLLVSGTFVGELATRHVRDATSHLAAGHAAVLTVPFLVLVAMSTIEWSARRDDALPVPAADTLGTVQVGVVVLGGLALLVGDLRHSMSLLVTNVPLELLGAGIFLLRVGARLFVRGWWHGPRVWLSLSAVSVAVDVGLFAHVVFEVAAKRYVFIESVPKWLVFAVDHVTFIAVTTTALFGAIALSGASEHRQLPGTDGPAAFAMIGGLLGAVVGIAANRPLVEEVSVCVLGAAIAVAGVAAAVRLRAATAARSPMERGPADAG